MTSGTAGGNPVAAESREIVSFRWALLAVGMILMLVTVREVRASPSPPPFQRFVLRATLALGVSSIVAAVPWFVGVQQGAMQTAGVTGGALAVFLLLFVYDPVAKFDTGTQAAGAPAAPLPVSPVAAASPVPHGRAFVFISYRRAEKLDVVIGRLREHLTSRFGGEAIFRDKDTITLGLVFTEVIDRALEHCRVMIVVIGPKWEQLLSEHRAAAQDDADFVMHEVSTALARGIPVIPILVNRTGYPAEQALPASLKPLLKRNGMTLRLDDPDFTNDVNLLADNIVDLVHTDAQRS